MLTLERPPLAVKLLKIFTETVCRPPGTPHIQKLRIPSVLAKSDPPVCPPCRSGPWFWHPCHVAFAASKPSAQADRGKHETWPPAAG